MNPLDLILNSKEQFASLESAFKMCALVVGGFWTYLLFVRKRQTYPRAKLNHRIFATPISDSKTLLRVTAEIRNEGDVLMQLSSGFTSIQRIKPWPDGLSSHAAPATTEENVIKTEFDWPTLEKVSVKFGAGTQEIEPKESDELHWDIVIDSSAEIVLVYTYIRNTEKKFRIKHWSQRVKEIGWSVSSIYDLKKNQFLGSESGKGKQNEQATTTR